MSGYSGIKRHELPDFPNLRMPCEIAAKIRRSDHNAIAFNGVEHVSRSESYNTAHAIQYVLAAVAEAMRTYRLIDDKLRGGNRVVVRCRIDVAFASGRAGTSLSRRTITSCWWVFCRSRGRCG